MRPAQSTEGASRPRTTRPVAAIAESGRARDVAPAVTAVAMISLHTSPLAQPGEGDSGGMNVYVRELAASLAQAGVRTTVYVRHWRPGLAERVSVEPLFDVVHVPVGPFDLAEGGPARGGRRVRRLGGRRHPSTRRRQGAPCQLLAVGASPHTGSSTNSGCRSSPPSTRSARVKASGGDARTRVPSRGRARHHRLLRRDLRFEPGRGRPARRALWSRPRPDRDRAARSRPRVLRPRRPAGRPACSSARVSSRCCCSSDVSNRSRAWIVAVRALAAHARSVDSTLVVVGGPSGPEGAAELRARARR